METATICGRCKTPVRYPCDTGVRCRECRLAALEEQITQARRTLDVLGRSVAELRRECP
jgi:tRNA(Ile2) C34 agmatinyltransferase TiaS